jgi:hypothetical protein
MYRLQLQDRETAEGETSVLTGGAMSQNISRLFHIPAYSLWESFSDFPLYLPHEDCLTHRPECIGQRALS